MASAHLSLAKASHVTTPKLNRAVLYTHPSGTGPIERDMKLWVDCNLPQWHWLQFKPTYILCSSQSAGIFQGWTKPINKATHSTANGSLRLGDLLDYLNQCLGRERLWRTVAGFLIGAQWGNGEGECSSVFFSAKWILRFHENHFSWRKIKIPYPKMLGGNLNCSQPYISHEGRELIGAK